MALFLAFSMLFGLGACAEQKTVESEPVIPEQQLEVQASQTATEVVGIEQVIVERELGPQPLQTANEATALALRFYIFARLKTEEFIQTDFYVLARRGDFKAK